MDEQTFWELVGTIGRDPGADAYDRLADQLSDHPAADIRDFADHLARALYALDTPAHYRAAPDRFLPARCAAVAAGPDAYRQVLASPPALTRYADRPGELHLPVAERAHRTATRTAWQHVPPVSHETGSNAAAWQVTWLHPLLGTTTSTDRAPRAYMVALQHVAVTLDGDPAWRDWWRGSGVPECELGIVAEGRLDHLRPSADIRKVADKVRANFTSTPPTGAGRPAELLDQAAAELTGIFRVIREAIGLPELPPMPPLPPLPEETPEVEVTAKSLPAASREPEQPGYLTLAQIQEFFG
jgi:hypothetical protein